MKRFNTAPYVVLLQRIVNGFRRRLAPLLRGSFWRTLETYARRIFTIAPHERRTESLQTIFSVRFFVSLLGIVLLALLATNAIWLLPSLSIIKEDVVKGQIAVAERARTAIPQFIAYNQSRLESTSRAVATDPKSAKHILEIFVSENTDFQRIVYIDAQGFERIRVDRFGYRELNTANRNEEVGIQTAFSGVPYFGPIFYSRGEPLNSIVVPIIDSNGNTSGTLEAELSLRTMWELMTTIQTDTGFRVYVVDQKGNLIADPDPSTVLRGENVLYRPVVQALIDAVSAAEVKQVILPHDFYVQGEHLNDAKNSVFVVGIPLANFNWGIFAEKPTAEAFAARSRTITLAGAAFGMVLFLLIIVAVATRNVIVFAGAVSREQEHIANILSNLTAGIIEYDQNFRVRMINSAAQELLNIHSPDLIGSQVLPQWLLEPDRRALAQLFFANENDPRTEEAAVASPATITVTVKQPLELNLRVTTLPIFTKSEAVTYVKVIQNITQEILIARMKSEFISIAAHQLRTPLSAIKWTFRLMLDGDLGALNDEQKDIVGKGYEANENMIHLVNDLLDVSRIEEGRFGYQFAKYDFRGFVKKTIETLQIELDKKNIHFSASVPNDIPPFLFDIEKLRLAFFNIFENAINYTPTNGTITLEVTKKPGVVEVKISDTGVGIPQGEMNRLFTKFYRGSNVVRMQTSGSGLGLFLVKNIILSHGGDIHIDSVLGKSTTVTVTLPTNEEKGPKSEKVFQESPNVSSLLHTETLPVL